MGSKALLHSLNFNGRALSRLVVKSEQYVSSGLYLLTVSGTYC